MQLFKTVLMMATMLLVSCDTNVPAFNTTDKGYKQEFSKSKEWVFAWSTCSGYIAVKKDGSLWQFGKVGGCNWGQILPVDVQTGKPMFEKKYIYHLHAKKIGDGFNGAKFISGGYRVYAIKKDGTLWGWGEGLQDKPMQMSKSHGWIDIVMKYEGNGCCAFDVGLKEDGSLWRFSEYNYDIKLVSVPEPKQISMYKNWEKIVFGCCTLYGVRADASLWKYNEAYTKALFVTFNSEENMDIADRELYGILTSKDKHLKILYNPEEVNRERKVRKDGTLWLLPEVIN